MSAGPDQPGRDELAGIESFLAELRESLAECEPGLVDLFDVFANEARVARSWLAPSLKRLPPGSPILEVGAGLMILSCELQREGFVVTALEPVGVGFSVFEELQERVLAFARKRNCEPRVLRIPVEELDERGQFAFAFSVNVMEHVRDVATAIARIAGAVTIGGEYRFTCPNYWFPYEPHFNIPTLFSKRMTERIFRRAIAASTRVSDPSGSWESLNWISVCQIRRATSELEGTRVTFARDALVRALARLGADPAFAARRSGWVRSIVTLLVRTGLHRCAMLIPVMAQPTIDCRIQVTGR